MKITSIDTALLAVPTPKPMALQYPQHKLVIAQIATDEGVRGLGYSSSSTAAAPRRCSLTSTRA